MKKVLLAFLLTLIGAPCFAQNESQTEYNFLRLPVSGHAAAIGGDNVTVIDDDEALIFNNPALLSSVSDKTINLNYQNYMSGVNTASASFNRVVKDRASWAVSGQYINFGSMKEVDENNVQTGDFSAKDISIAGYFSYLLTDRLSGGISAKWVMSYLGDYNSIGFCVDLGVNYYDPDREWSLSFVLKNLGGELKAYDDDYGKMPFDIQLGVSKRFVGTPFRVHATLVDLNHPHYKFFNHFVLGADLLLTDNIWIGGGYNFRRADQMQVRANDGKKSSHAAGLTLGGGIGLKRFHVSAAWGKYHVSSNSITISLGYAL